MRYLKQHYSDGKNLNLSYLPTISSGAAKCLSQNYFGLEMFISDRVFRVALLLGLPANSIMACTRLIHFFMYRTSPSMFSSLRNLHVHLRITSSGGDTSPDVFLACNCTFDLHSH